MKIYDRLSTSGKGTLDLVLKLCGGEEFGIWACSEQRKGRFDEKGGEEMRV